MRARGGGRPGVAEAGGSARLPERLAPQVRTEGGRDLDRPVGPLVLLEDRGDDPDVSASFRDERKGNTWQPVRDGDWKYLKIRDNTFLFNVEEDPLERANLKDRRPEIYSRLVADYRAWNATMLPLDPGAHTDGPTGSQLADHFGITKPKDIGALGK